MAKLLNYEAYQALRGGQLSTTDPGWGAWQVPERELQILGDVRNKDVLEFGCGAAQWSICLARRGARAPGLDLSARQPSHARRLIAVAGVSVSLILASAEDVTLRSDSFDIVFCDDGAMTFADPGSTVPEAARLLRPGGLFAFSVSSPLLELCRPGDAGHPGTGLAFDYLTMRWLQNRDQSWFQLPYGEWFRLFRRCGLLVEDLLETRPGVDATSTYRDGTDRDWARRWPAENIWKLRKG